MKCHKIKRDINIKCPKIQNFTRNCVTKYKFSRNITQYFSFSFTNYEISQTIKYHKIERKKVIY